MSNARASDADKYSAAGSPRGRWSAPSHCSRRQTREVPLVRNAQGDEIRRITAKLVRDAVDLAFFSRRDRFVGCRQREQTAH
jgi:hypothetical protein